VDAVAQTVSLRGKQRPPLNWMSAPRVQHIPCFENLLYPVESLAAEEI
jgi:hypothetical protein